MAEAPTFDTGYLSDVTDVKLSEVIDAALDDGLCCGCNTSTQNYVNKLLIIRKGIDLDLQIVDIVSANSKLELLTTLLDGGDDPACGC